MLWDVLRCFESLCDVVKCCVMLDVRLEISDYDFHIFLFKLFFYKIKIHNPMGWESIVVGRFNSFLF